MYAEGVGANERGDAGGTGERTVFRSFLEIGPELLCRCKIN